MKLKILKWSVAFAIALWLVLFWVVEPLKLINDCLGQLNSMIAESNKLKTEETWSRVTFCASDKEMVTTYKSCLDNVRKRSWISPEVFFKIKGNAVTPQYAVEQHNQFCSDFSATIIN
jgi:hypothetical protein